MDLFRKIYKRDNVKHGFAQVHHYSVRGGWRLIRYNNNYLRYAQLVEVQQTSSAILAVRGRFITKTEGFQVQYDSVKKDTSKSGL